MQDVKNILNRELQHYADRNYSLLYDRLYTYYSPLFHLPHSSSIMKSMKRETKDEEISGNDENMNEHHLTGKQQKWNQMFIQKQFQQSLIYLHPRLGRYFLCCGVYTQSVGMSGILRYLQAILSFVLKYSPLLDDQNQQEIHHKQLKNYLLLCLHEAIAFVLWKGGETTQAFQAFTKLLKIDVLYQWKDSGFTSEIYQQTSLQKQQEIHQESKLMIVTTPIGSESWYCLGKIYLEFAFLYPFPFIMGPRKHSTIVNHHLMLAQECFLCAIHFDEGHWRSFVKLSLISFYKANFGEAIVYAVIALKFHSKHGDDAQSIVSPRELTSISQYKVHKLKAWILLLKEFQNNCQSINTCLKHMRKSQSSESIGHFISLLYLCGIRNMYSSSEKDDIATFIDKSIKSIKKNLKQRRRQNSVYRMRIYGYLLLKGGNWIDAKKIFEQITLNCPSTDFASQLYLTLSRFESNEEKDEHLLEEIKKMFSLMRIHQQSKDSNEQIAVSHYFDLIYLSARMFDRIQEKSVECLLSYIQTLSLYRERISLSSSNDNFNSFDSVYSFMKSNMDIEIECNYCIARNVVKITENMEGKMREKYRLMSIYYILQCILANPLENKFWEHLYCIIEEFKTKRITSDDPKLNYLVMRGFAWVLTYNLTKNPELLDSRDRGTLIKLLKGLYEMMKSAKPQRSKYEREMLQILYQLQQIDPSIETEKELISFFNETGMNTTMRQIYWSHYQSTKNYADLIIAILLFIKERESEDIGKVLQNGYSIIVGNEKQEVLDSVIETMDMIKEGLQEVVTELLKFDFIDPTELLSKYLKSLSV